MAGESQLLKTLEKYKLKTAAVVAGGAATGFSVVSNELKNHQEVGNAAGEALGGEPETMFEPLLDLLSQYGGAALFIAIGVAFLYFAHYKFTPWILRTLKPREHDPKKVIQLRIKEDAVEKSTNRAPSSQYNETLKKAA
jgi:hypothetical protein